MSLLLNAKATISMNVEFYDDQEKQDFEKWANATQIKSIARQTIGAFNAPHFPSCSARLIK